MSESLQDTATAMTGDTSTETAEYETSTAEENDNETTASSVASSQPASSVSSFFNDNKAPESEYETKIRQSKEFEERKNKRAHGNCSGVMLGEDNTAPMAPEHHTVEAKRRQWDQDLQAFRETQRKLLKNIRVSSKRKVAALHERIFYTIRWANPVLPSTFRKILLGYCEHLMGEYPERKYAKFKVMEAWISKFSHTAEAKVVHEVKDLCERLRVLVLKRDEKTVKTIVKLEEKTELMTIKKEGGLRWHMETMHCARDDYWTIWYLSRRNLPLELIRMLETCKDVDIRDPDFGLTPLHYACKENNWEIFNILLKHGASEKSEIEEDGRQPLHLAAQYGTKEMCLELLAVGADYYAKDKYACTPLDLAIQSKNYPVIKVLQNWTQLLPPEEEAEEAAVDLSEVPEEFMSTPYEVLLTMSPPLRVLTTRLEGSDVSVTHSMDSGMPLGVEIRLCERRSVMCADEGFGFEAMKSRKRRWTVAKNGYLRQLEADKHSTGGERTPAEASSVKEVVVEKTEAEKEGPVTSKAASRREVSALRLTPALLYSICSDLFESLITEKFYEDAERVMTEGLAVIVLDDAARITFLKRHCEVLLFLSDEMIRCGKARSRVEVDMSEAHNSHVFTHNSNKKNKSKNTRSSTIATSAPSIQVNQSFAVEEFNHTTSYASLNVSDDGESLHHPPHAADPFLSTAPSLLEPSRLHEGSVVENNCVNLSASAPLSIVSPDMNRDESIHASDNSAHQLVMGGAALHQSNSVQGNEKSFSVTQNFTSHQVILMRAEGEVNEGLDLLKSNYDFNFLEPVSLSPLLELGAEVADRQGRYIDALHFMEHAAIVKERALGQAHCDTVRLFIEALRLLLRKQLVLASMRKEKRDVIMRQEDDILNESVSSKLKNEKKMRKIREARNKEALAEDKKRFSEVGQQATDVSRRLDRLSLENEDEARKLSTKCYNLVSLTELIVQGEVEPNKVLPSTGESVSLRSLSLRGKEFPSQMMHALDRSTYGEADLIIKTNSE